MERTLVKSRKRVDIPSAIDIRPVEVVQVGRICSRWVWNLRSASRLGMSVEFVHVIFMSHLHLVFGTWDQRRMRFFPAGNQCPVSLALELTRLVVSPCSSPASIKLTGGCYVVR